MAENGSTKITGSGETAEKIRERFLTCPICYEIYDQPKCLPCLHTFCHACLASYIESQRDMGAVRKKGFPCPVCKQFVFVKSSYKPLSEWVDDIQKNFLFQNMIDSLKPESKSTSPPQSRDTTTTDSSSAGPAASAPPPEPEVVDIDSRPVPSAPPLNLPPSRSSTYHWDVLHTGYNPASISTHVAPIPEVIRPSRSTIDIRAPSATSMTVDNLFRDRSNNDLTRQETVVSFTESQVLFENVYRRNSYGGNPKYSDICYLPKRNSIVVTDYNNNKIVYYKCRVHQFDFPKAVKVKGRPCSLALLDEEDENCVVINLQNKGVLIFISVPNMEILREAKTEIDYRSVAVISPDTLLAGSPDRPACIHLIKIGKDYKIKRRYLLIKNDKTWDLSSPDYICVLSPTSFMVSDSGKKSLICFDIVEKHGSKQAVKRFSLAPTADRKFRNPGALTFDRSSQSVYTVDYGNHAVLRIVPGDTLLCETLLRREHNIYRPSAVCLGPKDSLCVVDWEGNISVYEPLPTNRPTHKSRTRVAEVD